METLQREKASLRAETERLSACLLQQEQTQEGTTSPFDVAVSFSSIFPIFFSPRAALAQQAASQATAALRAELDEERRKHQGLLREFTRLEQRYDNLREMSQLTQVHDQDKSDVEKYTHSFIIAGRLCDEH